MDFVFFVFCFFFMTISYQVKIQTFIFIFISLQSTGGNEMAEAIHSYILYIYIFKKKKKRKRRRHTRFIWRLNFFLLLLHFLFVRLILPPAAYHPCFSVTLQVKPALTVSFNALAWNMWIIKVTPSRGSESEVGERELHWCGLGMWRETTRGRAAGTSAPRKHSQVYFSVWFLFYSF